jgi:ACS family hexuronate transporter-like MFS transporter
MMLSYIDRVTVSFLKDEIQALFGINNTGYAWVANVFIFFYAVMYPVSGWLVDRFGGGDGVRRLMFGGIIVWSLACLGAAFTRTVGLFGVCRAVLGMAEPMAYGSQIRVVTEWFPVKSRATANSLCVAGGTIGMVVAAPLLVWLKSSYNWQAAFIVPGATGLLIGFLWLAVYRNPPAELLAENIGASSTAREPAFTWPRLWKTRTLWGMLLCRFISDPVWYFCLFWLPGYLKTTGFTEGQVGMFGWIPYLFAAVGGIGSGMISDRLVRKGMAPLRSRKLTLTGVAVVMPVFAFTPHLQNHPLLVIAIFSVVCAVCLSWLFSLSVVIAEAFPTRNVGGVLGIAAGFGAAGGFVFNLFVGRALDTVGPAIIFAMMGGLHLLASVVLWTMARRENPGQAGR